LWVDITVALLVLCTVTLQLGGIFYSVYRLGDIAVVALRPIDSVDPQLMQAVCGDQDLLYNSSDNDTFAYKGMSSSE